MDDKKLREKAKEIIHDQGKKQNTEADHKRVIEELQIHQVELELQNEELRKIHQEIENSRNKFLKLFENAPIGYFVLNNRGIIKNVNQTLCNILDYDKSEMVNIPLFGFVHKDDQSELMGRFKAFFAEPRNKLIKAKLLKRNDDLMYAELTASKDNFFENIQTSKDEDVLLVNVVDITHRIAAHKNRKQISDRLETIFNQSAVGIAEVSPEGSFIRVNKRFADIIGYEIEDLENTSFQDITHPDDLCLDEKYIAEVLDGKRDSFEIEKRYIHKDGHYVWIKLYSNVVRDRFGDPEYAIATIADISEQKRARTELESKSERLNLAMISAKEGVWEWDLISGKAVFDANALNMLGYQSPFFQSGEWWVEQIHKDDIERVRKNIENYLTGKKGNYEQKFRIKSKDGVYIWISSVGKVIKYTEKGDPWIFIGIHRNITSSIEILENVKQYEFIIDSIQEPMSILDTELNYLKVNNAYLDYYKIPKKDIEGKSVRQLMGKEVFQKNVKPYLDRALKGETVRYQSWFKLESSPPFYHDVIYSPYKDENGNVTRIFVSSRDLTKQKLAEERSRKTEYMIEQIYNVSVPIWLINKDFVIERVNQAFCDLFELDKSSIIGKKCYDVMQGPLCKKDECPLHQKMIDNISRGYEIQKTLSYDNTITCLVSAQAVYNEDKDFFGVIETFTDVTELKHIQQLLQAKSEEIISQNEELNAQNEELIKGYRAHENTIKELEDSENRFRFLSEVSLEGIIVSENFIVIDANEAILNMTGYSKEDVIGMELIGFFPDDVDVNAIREAIKNEKRSSNRIFIKRKDGSIFPAESNCRDLNRNGKTLRISSVRDITQQVEMEKQLALSEHKFHTYIESAPNGFFVADSTGQYLEVNPASCRITGYSEEELLTMKVGDLIADCDKELGYEHFKSLNEKDFASSDIRFVHKNGEIRYWNVIGKKIADDRYIAFTKDVTERKKIEEEIKQNEALLNQVGDIAHIGGWEMDIKTGRAKWTKGTYNIVEIDPEQPVPGLYEHTDYYLPKYRDMINKKMKALIENGENLEFEAELKTAKGKIKWCKAYGKSILENGECIKVYGTFQDISQIVKMNESMKVKNAQLESLLQNTSDYILLSNEKAEPVLFNKAYADIMKKTLNIEMKPGIKPHLYTNNEKTIEFWEKMHERVLNGEKFSVEYKLDIPNGETIYLDVSYCPIIEDGIVKGFSEISRDITIRKKNEQELAFHRDNLEKLVEERTKQIKKQNEDLISMQKLFTGREFRIKELRDEIKELKKKLPE